MNVQMPYMFSIRTGLPKKLYYVRKISAICFGFLLSHHDLCARYAKPVSLVTTGEFLGRQLASTVPTHGMLHQFLQISLFCSVT
jgi:hypothetical protein